MQGCTVVVSVRSGCFFKEEEIYQWSYVLYYKCLHFELVFILEMEEDSWILSTSFPGNIEAPKTGKNSEDSGRFRRSHLQHDLIYMGMI